MSQNKKRMFTSTFSHDFLKIINSHKIYGHATKSEFVETALINYKNNFNKDITKELLISLLKNVSDAFTNFLDNQISISVKQIFILDYLITNILYNEQFLELYRNNPDQINLEIEKAELYANQKINDIVRSSINLNKGD